jgi:guanylate kinase
MSLQRRGLCLVLAAPSGAGKTTITRRMLALEPELALSVSVTTRAPRPGEIDGVHYHFVSQDRFDAMAREGALLEWAGVFGKSYGTPRAPVMAALAQGRDIAFDIDWQGHRQLGAALPGDVVGVFILPPSMAELERRLRSRGTDPEPMIARRMEEARAEMSHAGEFDHIIVNDTLDDAIARTRAVLAAARCATSRLTGLDGFLAGGA